MALEGTPVNSSRVLKGAPI